MEEAPRSTRCSTAWALKPSFAMGDVDFGLVGEVQSIDPTLVRKLQQDNYIPVIAPIGTDREGKTYNINADLVAGAMAAALGAEKLVMMTDVKGIRDANGRHLSTVSRKDG